MFELSIFTLGMFIGIMFAFSSNDNAKGKDKSINDFFNYIGYAILFIVFVGFICISN